MRGIVVLVPAFPYENENLDLLLPPLAAECARAPAIAALDTLRLCDGRVEALTVDGSVCALADAALVLLLGFGVRSNFLDKLQLLRLVERDVRIVNSCDALLYRHAKYHLTLDSAPLRHPQTFASHDADWLLAQVRRGGRWVAKPPAGSFGRGVFFIDHADETARRALDHLTDFGRGQYCLLQQRVDSDRAEHRVLIAGGEVIGAYARDSGRRGHGNLARGATPRPSNLDAAELDACRALAQRLHAERIGYAGIDVIYPWCVEINLANPGGLSTLVGLGDRTAPERCARALVTLADRLAEPSVR